MVHLNKEKFLLRADRFEVEGKGVVWIRNGKKNRYYKAIRKGSLIIKSSRFYTGSSYRDFYAMDRKKRCFLIRSIFMLDSETFCEANELVLSGNLAVRFNGDELIIPNTRNAVLSRKLVKFNVQRLAEKVMFQPKFDNGRSLCSDVTSGYIVRTIHSHN